MESSSSVSKSDLLQRLGWTATVLSAARNVGFPAPSFSRFESPIFGTATQRAPQMVPHYHAGNVGEWLVHFRRLPLPAETPVAVGGMPETGVLEAFGWSTSDLDTALRVLRFPSGRVGVEDLGRGLFRRVRTFPALAMAEWLSHAQAVRAGDAAKCPLVAHA